MRIANTPFTESERRSILDRYFTALDRLESAEVRGGRDDQAVSQVSDLWDEYVAKTPLLELAKSPLDGQVFAHSLDTLGLDGPWWDFQGPMRRFAPLPKGVLAFTGAVRLTEPVENTPFVCKPGPGRPFVVPRLLKNDDVKAVLTQLQIGRHTGFAVVYFCPVGFHTLPRFNTWGAANVAFQTADDDVGWTECETRPEDFDFDLRPWIESKKLLWNAPGDSGLDPKSGTVGCPYLSLEGETLLQTVSAGKTWTWEPWAYDDPGEVVDAAEPVQAVAVQQQEPSLAPPPVQPDSPQARFCGQCGTALKPGAAFCGNCGARVGG